MSKQRSKEPVSGTVHQNGGFGSSFGFVLSKMLMILLQYLMQ